MYTTWSDHICTLPAPHGSPHTVPLFQAHLLSFLLFTPAQSKLEAAEEYVGVKLSSATWLTCPRSTPRKKMDSPSSTSHPMAMALQGWGSEAPPSSMLDADWLDLVQATPAAVSS